VLQIGAEALLCNGKPDGELRHAGRVQGPLLPAVSAAQ
jgi:hypothetical protein